MTTTLFGDNFYSLIIYLNNMLPYNKKVIEQVKQINLTGNMSSTPLHICTQS